MAFINLPPNLQDIFYSITDRIAKLETGPNQPMYYAESAQASAQSAQASSLSAQTSAASAAAQATIAQSQAITAQATANTAYLAANVASAQAITATNVANAAASQATIAQSQATIASSQATQAQTSANSKNKIIYGTSATPPAGTYQNGDIYYQYDFSNRIVKNLQYNGSSWVTAPFTTGTITALDAGAITTGTLSSITISAGSGSNSFYVSSAGVMSAQGAYIKGNITADSGTFNGTINAASGYFGSLTNGWQINAGGIAGLGTGYISGGTIQGANFNNGSGTFYVNSAGAMTASNADVKGAIKATSGYFGSLTNGWQIDATGITGLGSGYISGGQIQGTSFNNGSGTFLVTAAGALTATSANITGTITSSNGTIGGWNIGTNILYTGTLSSPNQYLNAAGGALLTGTVTLGALGVVASATIGTSLTVSSSTTFGTSGSQFEFLATSGNVRVAQTFNNNLGGTTRPMYVGSSGLYGYVSSTRRNKHDITNYAIDSNALLNLPVRKFKYNNDETNVEQYGFIAEEAQELGLNELIQYDSKGIPSYFAYDKLSTFLLQLIQEQDARIKLLEGK